jgi:hypothetical protein
VIITSRTMERFSLDVIALALSNPVTLLMHEVGKLFESSRERLFISMGTGIMDADEAESAAKHTWTGKIRRAHQPLDDIQPMAGL